MVCLGQAGAFAQTQAQLEVHFLYGSKPRFAYRHSEKKWFGGMLGGHVGIGVGADSVLSFVPAGKFHWVAQKDERHSRFILQSRRDFWEIFGGEADSVQQLSFVIPVSHAQKSRLDSISRAYRTQTPYDYALVGVRCAAATADILAEVGVLKRLSARQFARIFYRPRILRRHMLFLAEQNGWETHWQAGGSRRKWER